MVMGDEKNRIKLLCSYGGKLLPRPPDGRLKYVGGDTRLFTFFRSVSFLEMRKKLTGAFDVEVAIKYSLMSIDLDMLVSVKTDEDVRHMVDEYSAAERVGRSPRFRVFLFTAGTGIHHHHHHNTTTTTSLEQRYIDAINSVPAGKFTCSPESSPTSTTTADSAVGLELATAANSPRSRRPMHKAYSSPNLRTAGHHQHYQQQPSRIPRPRQHHPGGGVAGIWRPTTPPPPPMHGVYEMSPTSSPRCLPLPHNRYFGPPPSSHGGSRKGSPRGQPHGSYFWQEEFCSCCSRRFS